MIKLLNRIGHAGAVLGILGLHGFSELPEQALATEIVKSRALIYSGDISPLSGEPPGLEPSDPGEDFHHLLCIRNVESDYSISGRVYLFSLRSPPICMTQVSQELRRDGFVLLQIREVLVTTGEIVDTERETESGATRAGNLPELLLFWILGSAEGSERIKPKQVPKSHRFTHIYRGYPIHAKGVHNRGNPETLRGKPMH